MFQGIGFGIMGDGFVMVKKKKSADFTGYREGMEVKVTRYEPKEGLKDRILASQYQDFIGGKSEKSQRRPAGKMGICLQVDPYGYQRFALMPVIVPVRSSGAYGKPVGADNKRLAKYDIDHVPAVMKECVCHMEGLRKGEPR